MHPSVPGDSPGAARLAVRLESAPQSGSAFVRLLDQYRGMLTHHLPKRAIHCLGAGRCPGKFHSLRATWKAYAPAEIWGGEKDPRWHPCVFEVTERLNETWHGLKMRGLVWSVMRGVEADKPKEVSAVLAQELDPAVLRAPFDILAALGRVYGTTDFLWVDAPILPPRVFLDASTDYPPPGIAAKKAEISPEEHAKVLEMLRAHREQRNGKNSTVKIY